MLGGSKKRHVEEGCRGQCVVSACHLNPNKLLLKCTSIEGISGHGRVTNGFGGLRNP